jgi:formylglycine-generating enzyme required for sulfatase activity
LSIQEGLSPYYSIDKVNQDPNNTNSYDTYKWTVTLNSSATGYRLPTEAQWEYAAKGGDGTPGDYTYSGSDDLNEVGWYSGNNGSSGTSAYGSKAVGTKAPNGLGIYDMSGNVFEWCWDWYDDYTSNAQTDPAGAASGSYRVIRGGSWYVGASYARSVYRLSFNPGNRSISVGFRLVRP